MKRSFIVVFNFNIFLIQDYFYLKLKIKQPLLHSSVSHDASEIIQIFGFSTKETSYIINAENIIAAEYVFAA